MNPSNIQAISLFGGPGGSTQGIKDAGVENVVSVEWDEAAVATARAAGHTVIHQDVRLLEPALAVEGWLGEIVKLLLQGSPPCQGLSLAGKGAGREDLEALLNAVQALSQESGLATTWGEARDLIPSLMDVLEADCADDRSPLTFEVLRWIFELTPDYIMLEQVPGALPIWEAIAAMLRSWGYSVWAGNVQAEQYGVPQTRKRAILLASIDSEVTAPVPTHSKYHNRSPERLDEGVPKWVSMAEALGWGVKELVGFPRKYDGRGESIEMNGELYRARDLREATNPSFVVTEKARSWNRYNHGGKEVTHMGDVRNKNGCVRPLDTPSATITASMDNGNFQFVDRSPEDIELASRRDSDAWIEKHGTRENRTADKPAPTLTGESHRWSWVEREKVIEEVTPRVNNQSGTEFDLSWPADRPAPTIAGRDLVTMPGANANRFNGSTKSRNDGIRVTVQEAGILQSFSEDYPWQGSKTKQHEQVGNAVPPVLQRALTQHLLGN